VPILGRIFKRNLKKSDECDPNKSEPDSSGIKAPSCQAGIDLDGEDEGEYEIVEIEIAPARIICPDCGGITLEGFEFCDKCGGELQ